MVERPKRRVSALAALTALAMLLGAGACGSGYQYAKRTHPKLLYRTGTSQSQGGLAQVEAASTYFKLPPGWRLLDEEVFIRNSGALDLSTPEQAFVARRKQRIQPFDAAPKPSVANILTTTSPHPSGFSQMYVLDDEERDNVSLRGLRNLLIPVDPDQLTDKANTEVLLRDDAVVRPGGFHGNRVLINVVTPNGTVLTVDKTTLVDRDTRVVYLFVVGCEAKCFRERQKAIFEVVDSWTIRDS